MDLRHLEKCSAADSRGLTRRRSRQAAECRARRPSRLVPRETDGVTPLAAHSVRTFFPRGKRRAARPLARLCGLQLSVCAVGRTWQRRLFAPSALSTFGTVPDTSSCVLAAKRQHKHPLAADASARVARSSLSFARHCFQCMSIAQCSSA